MPWLKIKNRVLVLVCDLKVDFRPQLLLPTTWWSTSTSGEVQALLPTSHKLLKQVQVASNKSIHHNSSPNMAQTMPKLCLPNNSQPISSNHNLNRQIITNSIHKAIHQDGVPPEVRLVSCHKIITLLGGMEGLQFFLADLKRLYVIKNKEFLCNL